jgi:hypothetical protein
VRVPVKVTVDGGAGTATLDGATHTGVPAGTTYAPQGWETVTDRYDVRLVGGVSHVDLDASPADARRGTLTAGERRTGSRSTQLSYSCWGWERSHDATYAQLRGS